MLHNYQITRDKAIKRETHEAKMKLKVFGRGKIENMNAVQKAAYRDTVFMAEMWKVMTDKEVQMFAKRVREVHKPVVGLF